MPLRYYQQDAKEAVQFAWEEFDWVLLHLGTGGGKTVIAADLISDLLPNRCLFLADQDELCRQPLDVISRFAEVIPALEKAKSRASLQAKVVVASAQTLSKKARLERFPPGFFRYMIVDEAHRGADRDQKIADYLQCKVVGITATPFKSNLRDLSKYYENVAFSMPMMDLVTEGFAPPMLLDRRPVEIDLADVSVKRGMGGKDYDLESLSTTIAPYYSKIVDMLGEEAENHYTLVRLPLIKSSMAFAEIARRAGINAIHVDGTMPDADEIIEGYRRGRYDMLCNANLIEVGVDIPIADRSVNLSPTHSPAAYQQFIGRICRVLPGVIDDIPEREQAAERRARIAESNKPNCTVVDFLWQHDRLGIMRPENLFATSQEHADAMFAKNKDDMTEEDLLALSLRVLEERENALVKQIEEAATRGTGNRIEPATFGYIIGSKSLMSYEPVARWEMEPPTKAQLDKLAKWGIEADAVDSKGLASKLMGSCIHRFKYRLASINQLRALQKIGVQFDPKRLTMKEAQRLISERKLTAVHSNEIPFE